MNNFTFIYHSNGTYLGFIQDDYLFSRDGAYLGWVEGRLVWDKNGAFRGVINSIGNHNYILVHRLVLLPTPRVPKTAPSTVVPPAPVENIIAPITLPIELKDGF